MANLFCDLTGGNNSNDGTSFANRVLTITGGITAARTAPGDVIRIMKSETPVSIGDATWTNKSATITLASALTKNIYLDGAWTANANVTSSTSTTRKEGSNCSSNVIASAFTTGQASYYDLGSSQDFSAYDSISLWLKASPGLASGALQIVLYSDAGATVAVETFTVNESLSSGVWKCVFLNKGSALSATVRTVGLVCVSDPGSCTVSIDNIIGCNTNSIDLTSVLTKSSSETNLEYYAIRSINGTTVIIDNNSNSNVGGTASRGYYGTTETVTTYKVRPIRIAAVQTIQEAGTASSRSTYSGGWDTTNMSTQTGVTIFDTGDEGPNNLSSTLGHLIFEKLVAVRGQRGFSITGGTNFSFNDCSAICTNSSSGAFTLVVTGVSFSNCHCYCNAGQGFGTSSNCNSVLFDSCTSNGNNASGWSASTSGQITLLSCIGNNNSTAGVDLATGGMYINKPTFKDNGLFGVSCGGGAATVIAPTSSANATAGYAAANGGTIFLDDTTNCSDTTLAQGATGWVKVSRVAGDPLDERIRFNGAWIIQTTSTGVHGSAVRGYSHTPQTGFHMSGCPLIQPTQPFAVNSTGTLTVSVWVKKSHATNVGAKLIVRGMQVDGISTDQVATAADNTSDQQLQITGSPSEKVPIVAEFVSWNATTTSTDTVLFSDWSVTQA